MEDDGLCVLRAPVLEEDFDAVVRGYGGHRVTPLKRALNGEPCVSLSGAAREPRSTNLARSWSAVGRGFLAGSPPMSLPPAHLAGAGRAPNSATGMPQERRLCASVA